MSQLIYDILGITYPLLRIIPVLDGGIEYKPGEVEEWNLEESTLAGTSWSCLVVRCWPLGAQRPGTPTIIRNKQSDVAVFYFPHCFIVCAVVRRLAGARWFIFARGECSRRHHSRCPRPTTLPIALRATNTIASTLCLMSHHFLSLYLNSEYELFYADACLGN